MDPIYSAKLLKKVTVANDTIAFHWEKPKGFQFKAGYYCDMTLQEPDIENKEEKERAFSIASAPFEENVVTATRISDSTFKQTLKDYSPGTELKFDMPRGDFTLHENEKTPAVFIIGGIGITPVRSIIAQATNDKLPHKLTLLYSNKTRSDAAFMDDLQSYAEKNPNFTFVPVMTETGLEEWNGETGLIDAAMVKRHVTDISAPIYYLCGPPGMVKDMEKMLIEMGANDEQIVIEEFEGY